MPGESYDLDPVETLAVATEGAPGSRRFFIRATAAGQVVTLACEKFHIQGLVARIAELLTTHGLDTESDVTAMPDAEQPLNAAWTIAELGLGYHDSRQLFVFVAREGVAAESDPGELESGDPTVELGSADPDPAESESDSPDSATARFWATPQQVRAFALQAEKVLAGGRPPCPYCGLPVDPGGHPCPASNGSRPIL
jgi:uncharacterized repeat protein (TIGR03847 family)